MARYLITLEYDADGDREPHEELKEYIEYALEGGAVLVEVKSITDLPDDDEEDEVERMLR